MSPLRHIPLTAAWALLAGALGIPSQALAQRYLIHTYGEADGLPSAHIADIVQDADGRIWFATRQHLVSYDGVDWATPRARVSAGPDSFDRVLVDDLDRVWALPTKAKNAVICRTDDNWSTLPRLPTPKIEGRWSAATTWTGPNGAELLGVVEGTQSFRCNGAAWERVAWPPALHGAWITDMEPHDGGKELYVATKRGAYRVSADFAKARIVPGTEGSRILGLGSDPNTGEIWVFADPWLARIRDGQFEMAVEDLGIGGLHETHYEGPIVDPLGGVFVSGLRHVMRYDPAGTLLPLSRTSGLMREGATGLLCDREGNVWIGSIGSTSKLVDLRFATLDVAHGLLESEVTSILQRKNGEIALGHPTGITILPGPDEAQLSQTADMRRIMIDVPFDPAMRLLDLEEDADGALWFAYQGRGLGRLDPTDEVTWFDEQQGNPANTVSILRDTRDQFWVLETGALYRLENNLLVKVDLSAIDIGPPRYCRKLFTARNGRILLATMNGLVSIHGDDVRRWTHPDDPRKNNVFSALESDDGTIWAGTTGGLQRVVDGALTTLGPDSDCILMRRPIYFLTQDQRGHLWCGTDDGVVEWDPSSPPQSARLFSVEDGLAGRETNRDAGFVASNGDVWIGTERGLSINRDRYRRHEPPPPLLRLLHVDVNGVKRDPKQPIAVPSGDHALIFHFRATGLIDEKRIQFRYRLTNYDEEWIGPKSEPGQSVRYTSVPAGIYRFELQARGHDTPWSAVISSADLEISGAIWEQPTFVITALLLLAALVYAVLRAIARSRSMKELEREVQARLQEIREIEAGIERGRQLQSLGVLAGGIAHDFNNLLTVMTGSFSLLEVDQQLNSEQMAICHDGLAATQRARALTQQLLTFSRGGAPLVRPGSISEVVRESARFVMRGSDVGCVTELPPDLWMVQMDPDQISQVVGNLLLNAKQATASGGTIVIRGRNRQPDQGDTITPVVEIEVEDPGHGISPDDLDHIFEPYYSTKDGGSGLGLATAHSIVQQHGGELIATSTLGRGTTMRFTVPATKQQHVEPEPPQPPQTTGVQLRILVMDDEARVRKVIGKMLEHLGHQPQFAKDGRTALTAYSQAHGTGHPFDAILMDLTIPGGLGGRQTLPLIQKLEPQVRAIVVSGYSNDPVMANYRDHGFCARLAKPVSIAELERALDEACGTRKR